MSNLISELVGVLTRCPPSPNPTPDPFPTRVAWGATFVCTWLSIECATHYGKRSRNIFRALAMFAMAWAVLLPYYSEQGGNEILSAFQGLLLVFSGAVLLREGAARGDEPGIARFDRWGLRLLLALILPHFVIVPGDPDFALRYHPVIDTGLGTLLALCGYASIAYGIRSITADKKWMLLVVALIFYGVLEVSFSTWYSVQYIQCYAPSCSSPPDCATPAMTAGFKFCFAATKLVTTLLFLWLAIRTIPREFVD